MFLQLFTLPCQFTVLSQIAQNSNGSSTPAAMCMVAMFIEGALSVETFIESETVTLLYEALKVPINNQDLSTSDNMLAAKALELLCCDVDESQLMALSSNDRASRSSVHSILAMMYSPEILISERGFRCCKAITSAAPLRTVSPQLCTVCSCTQLTVFHTSLSDVDCLSHKPLMRLLHACRYC